MSTTGTIATAASGVATRAKGRQHTAERGSTGQGRQNGAGWALSTPFVVLYGLFLIGPVLIGFVISLFNTTTVTSGFGTFVGFSNYADVLTRGEFWVSMWHSVLFTLLSTRCCWCCRWSPRSSRPGCGGDGSSGWRSSPPTSSRPPVCLIFAFMYTPQTGLITNAFGWFGLTPPDFLGSTNGAWLAVILLTLWWTFGFNFILYTAGLQDIPEDVYEAASIDGAGPWQQIRYITVPLLSPTISLVFILQLLSSLKVFDQIYILLAGGPNYSTRPVIQYIYDTGFTAYRGGYAAAATMVYFLILVGVSVAWLLLRNRRGNLIDA